MQAYILQLYPPHRKHLKFTGRLAFNTNEICKILHAKFELVNLFVYFTKQFFLKSNSSMLAKTAKKF